MPVTAACRGLARLAVVAVLTGMVVARAAGTDGPSPPLPVEQVAPGVYVHQGPVQSWDAQHQDVANLGFVVGERCVAVIDTGGSPDTGRRWLATIRQVSSLPVCHVILTHVHPDHLLGSSPFTALQPRPTFVGHQRLAAAITARGPYYQRAVGEPGASEAAAAPLIVSPDKPVADSVDLDLGGRVLRVQAWPTAHTDGDLTVIDLKTRTGFLSDLLFREHLPVVDGSLRGWVALAPKLRQLDLARVVPGHGAVGHDWPRELEPQQAYPEHLLGATREAIRQGRTIREAVEGIGPGPDQGWRLVDDYHRRNLTAAYAELEWE